MKLMYYIFSAPCTSSYSFAELVLSPKKESHGSKRLSILTQGLGWAGLGYNGLDLQNGPRLYNYLKSTLFGRSLLS